MIRICGRLLVGLVVIAIAGDTPASEPRLSLHIHPTFSTAPCMLTVQATVARNTANRSLVIEADSGEFYRSATIQLDGDRAPMISEIRFTGLPGGTYSIAAILRDERGAETTVRQTLIVRARFGDP